MTALAGRAAATTVAAAAAGLAVIAKFLSDYKYYIGITQLCPATRAFQLLSLCPTPTTTHQALLTEGGAVAVGGESPQTAAALPSISVL